MAPGDEFVRRSYQPNVPKKATPPLSTGPDWFLGEWMRTLGVTQAEIGRQTGWGKARANDIFHGKTSYYREILNEAADALRVRPFELLMPPAEAFALRRMRESAVRIAADTRIEYAPEPASFFAAHEPRQGKFE